MWRKVEMNSQASMAQRFRMANSFTNSFTLFGLSIVNEFGIPSHFLNSFTRPFVNKLFYCFQRLNLITSHLHIPLLSHPKMHKNLCKKRGYIRDVKELNVRNCCFPSIFLAENIAKQSRQKVGSILQGRGYRINVA